MPLIEDVQGMEELKVIIKRNENYVNTLKEQLKEKEQEFAQKYGKQKEFNIKVLVDEEGHVRMEDDAKEEDPPDDDGGDSREPENEPLDDSEKGEEP